MKLFNYSLVLFFVCVSSLGFSQNEYIRNRVLINQTPRLDSSYQWNNDITYPSDPFQYESRTYYTYDSLSRKIREIVKSDFNSINYSYFQFYRPDNLLYSPDSAIRISNSSNDRQSFSYEYLNDTLISRFNYYVEGALTSYSIYTYTWQGPDILVNVNYYKVVNNIAFKDTLSLEKAILQNGIIIQSERNEAYPNSFGLLSYKRELYWNKGETSINLSVDSSAYYETINNVPKLNVQRLSDSSIILLTKSGSITIKQRHRWSTSFYSADENYTNEYLTIDSIYGNGSIMSFQFNFVTGQFEKTAFKEANLDGQTNYIYKDGRRYPSFKSEGDNRNNQDNCRTRKSNAFEWVNNNWLLTRSTIRYYNGPTSPCLTEEPKCIITNPFSPVYPLSCVTMNPTELYTLFVYDSQGSLALEKEFKMDQVISQLSNLTIGRIYYFVILNNNGELIAKQKILIQN